MFIQKHLMKFKLAEFSPDLSCVVMGFYPPLVSVNDRSCTIVVDRDWQGDFSGTVW